MTTSKLTVDEGTQTPLASYEINEDAEDKQLSRTVLNNEDGDEVGTVADPLHVTGTIAATLSEPISVDDNGGSLTVDGTVTAVASGDHTVVGKAADGAAVSGNPVLVAGQDGTNTQSLKTNSTGQLEVAVVSSTGGGLTDAELRASPVPVSNDVLTDAHDDPNNAIRVNVVAGSTGGPGKVDDAAFGIGTDSVNPVGYLADESGPDSVNEGDVGLARMSLNRIPYATLRDAAGNERGANVTAGNALVVDGSAVTQPVSDAGGSLTVDNATISVVGGGTEATAQRVTIANDSTGVLSVDDNGGSLTVDGTVAVTQSTSPWVTNDPGLPNALGQSTMTGSTSVAIASDQSAVPVSGTVTITPSGTQNVQGVAADGTAVASAGNPVVMAGQDGTLSQSILTDSTGRQVVVGAAADGAAIAGNPVLIAGQDGTNVQSLITDTTGNVGTYPKVAATALADNVSNTISQQTGISGSVVTQQVFPSWFDGTTWDRARGDSTDGLLVNLGANNDITVTSGAITETNSAAIAASLSVMDDWDESDRAKVNPIAGQAGVQGASGTVNALTQRVVLATDVALPAGTNAIGKLSANSGVDIGDVDVTSLPADLAIADDAAFTVATSKVIGSGHLADETSTDSVDEGDIGIARMTLDRKLIVTPEPHTQGGLLIAKNLDVDESEDAVKASRGQIYGWAITNRATTTRWIKFYNDTVANVVVGTTVPVLTWGIPGNTTDNVAANAFGAMGIEFDTAITIAATTGFADADTGAPGTNDVICNIFYR